MYREQQRNLTTQLQNPRESIDSLLRLFKKRKSTRIFSDESPDLEIIKKCIEIAATAPSGANKQPWSFCLITNKEKKQKIREVAEIGEKQFYLNSSLNKWHEDLKEFNTYISKPFLTKAYCLIPVFYKNYELDKNDQKSVNYYAKESVGISVGFLISALHMAGLSVLTYTPSDKKPIGHLLDRPKNDILFMLLAVGLPDQSEVYPSITKKPINEILTVFIK